MSSALQATIRELSETFADGVIAALLSATPAEILGNALPARAPGPSVRSARRASRLPSKKRAQPAWATRARPRAGNPVFTTDYIFEVLGNSGPLSAKDVMAGMQKLGWTIESNNPGERVSVYLYQLLKAKKVARIEDGRYRLAR